MASESMSSQSLSEQLNAKRSEFAVRAPLERQRLYEDGIEAVRTAGVVDGARRVGDVAPDFSLADANGRTVSLSSLLAQGPVVLTWYRGGWCPYCNLTLQAYQERLDELRQRGAQLVALTPELPDRSLSTAEKNGLAFHVLSDVRNRVAASYGIVFDLTPGVRENYQQAFDLLGYNGSDSGQLPLAAVYVISPDGVIRWAFLDEDYRNRAEPQDIIDALDRL